MLADSETVKSPLQMFTLEAYLFPPNTFKCNRTIVKTPTEVSYTPAIIVSGQTGSDVPILGVRLAANITRILQTSDDTPGECDFTIPNAGTSVFQDSETEAGAQKLHNPSVGDEIVVFVSSAGQTIQDDRIMFKGFVSGVSNAMDDSGIILSVSCRDMKARMMDEMIFKEYNVTYDISRQPNFSEKDRYIDSTTREKGKPMSSDRWTVEKIINDIFRVAESQWVDINPKYRPVIYFDEDSLRYDSVPELKDFVPPYLSFDNKTVLSAIYETINMAGSYRMSYDPQTDKIVFTQIVKNPHLSFSAGKYRSGKEIPLIYATADKSNPNVEYAQEVNVVSDNTSRRTEETANILRLVGSNYVSWYSGHYYIAKSHRNLTDTSMSGNWNKHSIYYMNNWNWDGYEYFFSPFNLSFSDDSFEPYMIVGMPLYPQWNPLDGYLPYEIPFNKSNARKITSDWFPTDDKKITSTDYDWTPPDNKEVMEYEGITMLDKAFPTDGAFADVSGTSDFRVALGHTYEAWFPWPGPCAYCGGSGAVSSIHPDWRENYEDWFGSSRDSSGSPNKPGTGMGFNYGFVQTTRKDGTKTWEPTNHPVPWLNTCLACRGTGYEPMFKIKNILENLVELPPDKSAVSVEAKKTTTDRTWEEMVAEYSDQYMCQIQLESTYMTPSEPVIKYSSAHPIPHPLAGKKCKIYGEGKENSSWRYIYPDNEKIMALYKTQVSLSTEPLKIDSVRGNIVFSNRQAIVCEKRLCMVKKHNYTEEEKNNRFNIIYSDRDGTPAYDRHAFNFRQVSYWRPARAWLTCYFTREKFYDNLENAPSNPRKINLEFTDNDPQGLNDEKGKYQVAFKIWEGRPVVEAKEVDNQDDTTEFNVRPVVKAGMVEEIRWQICPIDMLKMAVPKTDNNAWLPEGEEGDYKKTILSKSIDARYWFPQGAVHIMEPFKQHEVENAVIWTESKDSPGTFVANKLKPDDVNRQSPQPKLKMWVHQDDRYKMISTAAYDLERKNDISVSGNITVRGINPDLSEGMGYVTCRDGKKACIVKMEHNFGDVFTSSIEVGTEEMRLGEPRERDKDYTRRLEQKVSALYYKAFRQKIVTETYTSTKTTGSLGATPSSGILKE